MAISYNRTYWQNGQTPLNQTNMNNIETGIVALANAFNAAPFTHADYVLLESVMDEDKTYIVASRATADSAGNVIVNSYPLKSSLSGGTAVRGIYLNNGTVNLMTYELHKTVPADAKFTDTTDLSQMTGVLPIEKGGTGGDNAADAREALGLGGSSTLDVVDNETPTAIGSSDAAVTERSVYNGLPKFNNGHSYTANSNFYAPTSSGSAGQILTSGGSGAAPTWKNGSQVSVGEAAHAATADSAGSATTADSATKATQDGNGNNIANTYSTKANTVKSITFNSDATATILLADGTTATYPVVGSLLPPVSVGAAAPTNTSIIWVDSANGYIGKVNNGTTWVAMRGAWG